MPDTAIAPQNLTPPNAPTATQQVADAPDISSPINAASSVMGGPVANTPTAPPKESFIQGMRRGGAGPQIGTDAQGNFINATPAFTPTKKGEFGTIMADALKGALAGMTSAKKGQSSSEALGAGIKAEQESEEKTLDTRQRTAQQQFQNRVTAGKAADEHALQAAEISRSNLQSIQLANQISLAEQEKPYILSRLDTDQQKDLADTNKSRMESEKSLQENYGPTILHFDPKPGESAQNAITRFKNENPKMLAQIQGGTLKIFANPNGGMDVHQVTSDNSQIVAPYKLYPSAQIVTDPKSGKQRLEKGTPQTVENGTVGDMRKAIAADQDRIQGMQNNMIRNSHEQAGTQSELAAAEHSRAETAVSKETLKEMQGAANEPDAFGNTAKIGLGGVKVYAEKERDFRKAQVYPLQKVEQQFGQFSEILKDINSGKDMTGAQSVVGLFNAIGISATPLKGSGFRVNSNTISEHKEARSLGQDLYQQLLSKTTGAIITPQQLKDYAVLASNARRDQYYGVIDQAEDQGLKVGFLPKPGQKGAAIDPGTAQIYMHAAHGDADKARKAAQLDGWSF